MDALENGSRIADLDFVQLAARAESQRDRVQDLRVQAAREALSA